MPLPADGAPDIRQTVIVRHATETIRSAVIAGTLTPGEPLPVEDIARWLDVEPHELETALDRLRTAGIIERRRPGVVVVTGP